MEFFIRRVFACGRALVALRMLDALPRSEIKRLLMLSHQLVFASSGSFISIRQFSDGLSI